MAIVTLRGDRRAKSARTALILASLLLLPGALIALKLFWPVER
ncbi:MAG: hypothetical protein ABIZ36_10930 [Gemmatimonadaceae bacterium]